MLEITILPTSFLRKNFYITITYNTQVNYVTKTHISRQNDKLFPKNCQSYQKNTSRNGRGYEAEALNVSKVDEVECIC